MRRKRTRGQTQLQKAPLETQEANFTKKAGRKCQWPGQYGAEWGDGLPVTPRPVPGVTPALRPLHFSLRQGQGQSMEPTPRDLLSSTLENCWRVEGEGNDCELHLMVVAQLGALPPHTMGDSWHLSL